MVAIKKKSRGQIDISFGMIFSIILIIATIAVAFYAISHFLDINKCVGLGTFFDDVKKEVDNAWGASISQKVLTESIPSGITAICFGNLSQATDSASRTQYESLKIYSGIDRNVFVYPSKKACDSGLANYKLNNARTNNFFCVPVQNGKISVLISKQANDALVTIGRVPVGK